MASVTRVNGIGHTHGTQYSVAQLKSMEVDAIVSLAGKGGLGSTIWMIVDGHASDAASLQVKLRALGTVDSIDLSSATVTETDLDGLSAS